MKPGLQMAGAIGVGYLLGRRRKTVLALALGVAAASGRLGRVRGALRQRMPQETTSSSGLGKLVEPGRRLLEEGRSAAIATATSRMETVSELLHDRAEAWRRLEPPPVEEESEQEPEQAREQQKPRKKAAKKAAKKTAKKAAKKTAKKAQKR